MKILFVSGFSAFGLESGANRLRKLARGLLEQGQEVDWIYSGTAGIDTTAGWKSICVGVIPGGRGGKIRVIFRLMSAIRAWLRANPRGICLISLPPPWLIAIAAPLALLFRRRVWLDFRDPIFNRDINPRSWQFRALLSTFEWIAVTCSGGCIFAAPRIEAMVAGRVRRGVTVYAGVDDAEKREIAALPVSRVANTGRFRLVYGGTFYGGRSPEILLEALSREVDGCKLSERVQVELYCSFNDPEDGRLFQARARTLGDCFRVEPLVPRMKFLEILKNSDASLIITHAQGSGYAIPGKIYDYLLVGRPIICVSQDLALRAFCEKFSVSARFVDPRSADELASVLWKQASQPTDTVAPVSPELAVRVQASRFLEQVEQVEQPVKG